METNIIALSVMIVGLAFLSGCGFDKLTPAGWRKPDDVIKALALKPGQHVADVGAGDGYFTFRLADAVGPEGRVYAVEVTDKLVDMLEQESRRRGYENVTVVRGAYDDPKLPDGEIDLVFFSGVFHHIDKRAEYFEHLQGDLAKGGRVAIIDGAPDPLHGLFMPFHFASAASVSKEMGSAGYVCSETFDFLPMMNFQVFVTGQATRAVPE